MWINVAIISFYYSGNLWKFYVIHIHVIKYMGV